MVVNFINNGIVYHCDSLCNKVFALLSLPTTTIHCWLFGLLSVETNRVARRKYTYCINTETISNLFMRSINFIDSFVIQQRSKMKQKEKRKRRRADSKMALIIQYFTKIDSLVNERNPK